MLRISVASDSSQAIQFQLEGNLAGPWVEELRSLTDDALSQKKAVSLDLRGVRFVDTKGVALLRELSGRRVSHVNCSQFVIQQMKEVEQ
jgi:ABC-type transporter Mla MlaB component